ncbi:MAG TPA: ABC transporter substrate-binding protein [Alphaproteobacteria bacterium]|nr:ABC transporter substrate-binding protein [Alphaproteobacteria bacterium]
MNTLKQLSAGLAAIGLATAGLAAQTGTALAEKKLVDVTFSLDFIVLGRHAPWYVALAKGYYKQEGLNVKIIPGRGSAQVMQAVQSGLAQIGFVDVPGVALARASGSTIKLVAVNYQKAPYAIFSLNPGANVTTAKQLEGLTLGSGAGSFTPKVIRGFMVQNGLDPKKLKIANVAPPARGGMLLSRKIPAIEFFVMAQPGLTRGAMGVKAKLSTYLLGNHGLQLYSNGIGATEAYIKKNPQVMKGFVRASLRGWKDALANPAEAADLQRRYAKGLKRDIIIAEIGVLRTLAVTPDTQKNGLGWYDPAKMKVSLDFVKKYVGIKGKAPKAEDLYVNGFLPATPIRP